MYWGLTVLLHAQLHLSGDPSTDFGHTADDARANASEAMVFANAADNSLNATDPDTADHEAFDPDTTNTTNSDLLEYFTQNKVDLLLYAHIHHLCKIRGSH